MEGVPAAGRQRSRPARRRARAGEGGEGGRRQAAVRLLQDPARRRGAEGARRRSRRRRTASLPTRPPSVLGPRPAETPPVGRQGQDGRRGRLGRPGGAKVPDRFWLQAGSFANEPDAENLRARLALAGWEAQLQQGTLPDKAVRYRVRLGPYDNTDELNRIKGELARRGFDVAVIRY